MEKSTKPQAHSSQLLAAAFRRLQERRDAALDLAATATARRLTCTHRLDAAGIASAARPSPPCACCTAPALLQHPPQLNLLQNPKLLLHIHPRQQRVAAWRSAALTPCLLASCAACSMVGSWSATLNAWPAQAAAVAATRRSGRLQGRGLSFLRAAAVARLLQGELRPSFHPSLRQLFLLLLVWCRRGRLRVSPHPPLRQLLLLPRLLPLFKGRLRPGGRAHPLPLERTVK